MLGVLTVVAKMCIYVSFCGVYVLKWHLCQLKGNPGRDISEFQLFGVQLHPLFLSRFFPKMNVTAQKKFAFHLLLSGRK